MFCLIFFFLMIRRPPRSTRTETLFPYTTLFRLVGRSIEDVLQTEGRRRFEIDVASGISHFTKLDAVRPRLLRQCVDQHDVGWLSGALRLHLGECAGADDAQREHAGKTGRRSGRKMGWKYA